MQTAALVLSGCGAKDGFAGIVPAPSHNEQIKKMKLQIRSLTSIMPEKLFS
jgi:hypothetical protein